MNIVNKLTLRHMKQNKRRTLVTIIGVIISVAMITAVMTLGVSFQDLLKRQTIAQSGDWHIVYQNVNSEQTEVIRNDEETSELALYQDKGFALISELGAEPLFYKPYIAVKAFDDRGLEKYKVSVVEGRLPQNVHEIVVPQHYLKDVEGEELAPGDEIKLSIGTRYLIEGTQPDMEQRSHFTQNDYVRITDQKLDEYLADPETITYTVVGIVKQPAWEYSWAAGYTFITYLDQSALAADDTFHASIKVNHINNDIYNYAEQLAASLHVKYSMNNDLLRYDFVSWNSGFVSAMYGLTAIIMGIVLVGSISLIYNAFGISVADRSRYLGMLASVGATRRQKRNSVFFEGFLISLISIPIGLVAGLLGLVITFWSINSMVQGLFSVSESLLVKVTPLTLIVSVGISLLTIFISTWLPAKRASKVSAIDAIRQSQDVKLSKKKVKTSKLVRKIYGIEAEIALKNLKRNKRRYQITVFSLVISILLFLSVSFFTNTMKKSLEVSNDGINYDIIVGGYGEEVPTSFDKISQLEDVTASNYLQTLFVVTDISKSQLPPVLNNMVEENPDLLTDGKMEYSVQVHAMTDEALTQYAKEQGIAVDSLLDESQMNAILLNRNSYYSLSLEKKVEEVPILNGQGTTLDLVSQLTFWDELENGEYEYRTENIPLEKLHITELTTKYPMGILKGDSGQSSLTLIVSQAVLKQIIGEQSEAISINQKLYLTSDNPTETQKQISEMDDLEKLYINNIFESRQHEEQMIILMSVFTYGFIALITMISIANILNTISTGIQLRKREFAMLRSMGMTEKGFYRMINYESIFYGIKALSYGLPLSLLVMFLIYRSMMNTMDYSFQLPWVSIGITVLAVFIIVGVSMLYSGSKVKRGSIVESLKQENM